MFKFRVLFILLFLFQSVPTFSFEEGREAGNGGGAWVCFDNQEVKWIRSIDLFEAETEFNLTLQAFEGMVSSEIVDFVTSRFSHINKNLSNRLTPYVKKIKKLMNENMVDSGLGLVKDIVNRVRPLEKDCHGGTIKYQVIANYTGHNKILVNKNLFNNSKFDEKNKAALIFHEAVYAFLRDTFGDQTSVRTRQVVGYLFSTMKTKDIQTHLDSILGKLSYGVYGMVFTPIYLKPFLDGTYGSLSATDKEYYSTLTTDYEIMTTEVTQSMYFDVMGTNSAAHDGGCLCPDSETRISSVTGKSVELCPNNPVENLTFSEIQKFISKLNSITGKNYRLPTDKEWDFAARAGESRKIQHPNGSINKLASYAIYWGNSWNDMLSYNNRKTYRVGPKRDFANKPNRFGLYDILGNVWEITTTKKILNDDCMVIDPEEYDDYYGTYNMDSNYFGAATNNQYIMIRGGSYENTQRRLNFDVCRYIPIAYSEADIGFRLVRTLKN